jgi:murein DD-endopeptidase MepM/ murein hydrolase activator NlpD
MSVSKRVILLIDWLSQPFKKVAGWWTRAFEDARIIIEIDGHVRHLHISAKAQRMMVRGAMMFCAFCVSTLAISAYLTFANLELHHVNDQMALAQKQIAKALSISVNKTPTMNEDVDPLVLANKITAQGEALNQLSARISHDLDSINRAMLSGLDGAVDIHSERAKMAKTGAGGKPVEPVVMASRNSLLEQQLEDYAILQQIYGTLPTRMPISQSYTITSGYGERHHPVTGRLDDHPGLDIAPLADERVTAVMDGVVEFAGNDGAYGNSVILTHTARVRTRYAHLRQINVTEGQKIHAGDFLGIVGSTGMSTGRHLHYEVLLDDYPVNPALAMIFNHQTP